MHKNIALLYQIAQKEEVIILGLMSGTSLDGLDLALCSFSGKGRETKYKVIKSHTVEYPADLQSFIREIFAKKEINHERLCLLNAYLGDWYASTILETLKTWQINTTEIDLIASHGQTVYHAPKPQHQLEGMPNATLQIGDADRIAVKTGILTFSDFRQKHIAAGGEGAPLAVYGDYHLFSDVAESRILLNLGGISNFTYLPKIDSSEEVLVSDVGPANTLMDATIRRYFSPLTFDKGGEIAQKGTVNQALLKGLLDNPFFKITLPKTTGPEVFYEEWVQSIQAQTSTQAIQPQDLITTLTELTAQSTAEALLQIPQVDNIYVSGGGAFNAFLLERLQAHLPDSKVQQFSALGVPPDAKESLLFAWLAYESLKGGNALKMSSIPAVSLGKLSFPS
jgi:anhydro-N-acetylmuramic acid kinase